MLEPAPKVTVGMGVYRGERFIAEAIASVLNETFRDWELLIVNDASPDNSVEVIRAFDDPRIRLLENATNQGLVAVRNRILNEARGDFIAWLDQDDLSRPNRMRTQVGFLEKNPDVALCGSWTHLRNEGSDGSVTISTQRLPASYEQIRAALMFLNPMSCNTVMMRRSAFVERGLLFRPEFGNTLDYDLWSNASDTMQICNLPVALAAYRIHASQTSRGAALDEMNDHALQVQVDLISRALGIQANEMERGVHRSATITPLDISEPNQLSDIACWFGRLKSANDDVAAFDRREFNGALARQWRTVVFAAARGALAKSAVLKESFSGFRQMEISPTTHLARAGTGLARRLIRH